MNKRSWRFIVVGVNCCQRNPYMGIARYVDRTSARAALNALHLPQGAFYGLVYEPRTRVVISAAMRVDGQRAASIPLHRGTALPINITVAELEDFVRVIWGGGL